MMKMSVSRCVELFGYERTVYFIMVGLEGTWLFEGISPYVKSEANCKRILENYMNDYGDELNDGALDVIRDTLNR